MVGTADTGRRHRSHRRRCPSAQPDSRIVRCGAQKVLGEPGFVNAAVDVIGRIIGDEPGYLPLLEHLGLANLTTVAGTGPTVTRVNWAWDELVLACDLVARNGWKSLPKDDLRVSALSAFLRRQPEATTSADFRSIGSVNRKLENIRSMHPDYPGVRTKGGKTTQQVVDAFVADPAGMHLVAQALWRAGNLHRDVHDDEDESEAIRVSKTTTEFVSAVEGRIVVKGWSRSPNEILSYARPRSRSQDKSAARLRARSAASTSSWPTVNLATGTSTSTTGYRCTSLGRSKTSLPT
jgi:hypothetical protein